MAEKERKRIALPALAALLFCLTFCGCAAPEHPGQDGEPPREGQPEQSGQADATAQGILAEQRMDDAHDAFLVDTGGSFGTLLVTVEIDPQIKDEFGTRDAAASVWDTAAMEAPLQTLPFEIMVDAAPEHHQTVDADFNGSQDFAYLFSVGNQPNYWCFWLWNEETGRFELCTALGAVSAPSFDAEHRTVHGWARDSAASGVETWYRWIDGALTLVRRMEYHYPDQESGYTTQLVTVEDLVGGEMAEVYRTVADLEDSNGERIDPRWYDLDYHGEA